VPIKDFFVPATINSRFRRGAVTQPSFFSPTPFPLHCCFFYLRESLTRFEVCFLIPLDSSDIASPDGTVCFFKMTSILCLIFEYSGPGAGSFPCERISAQGAAAAHSTLTQQLIFVIVFITHTQLKYYYIIKSELQRVSCSPILLPCCSSYSCGRSLSKLPLL
jgi:hypothetical protein